MRGRRAVDSFFSQTHDSSNLVSSGRKAEPFSGSQCAGVPCSHWCPQLSSAPVSEASSQERGWLSLCGPQYVSCAPAGLKTACVSS